MNEEPNAPMLPVRSPSILQTWMSAVTKPNEQTYAQLAASPQAKTSTALLWVFIASLIQSLIAIPMQGRIMAQMMQGTGLENQAGPGLVGILCGAPIAAVITVVFFSAFTGIVQWVAGLFGGKGSFQKLAYVFAAIIVPFTLLSALITLLSAVPYVGACFGIIGLLAGLYVLVLQVMAVKGVNRFDWLPAAGSVLLPLIAFICCISAGVAGLVSLAGPAMQDIFDQINQSITP
ncbi:MAG: Yip1 family protein [Anaerolineales bacterium]